jgi:hypothetical protein
MKTDRDHLKSLVQVKQALRPVFHDHLDSEKLEPRRFGIENQVDIKFTRD